MTNKLNLNETSSPAPGKYCPTCFLSGSALGSCGNFALGCPEPQDIRPDIIVEISCGPCGKQLAVPIAAIMKHRTKELGLCTLDNCAAVLMPTAGISPPMPLPEALGEEPVVEETPVPESLAPTPPARGKKANTSPRA